MAKTPITWEEIALHDKTDNCWIVINDKVYDPTNFLINHPGGPQAILNLAGKDATNEFKKVGHGKTALAEMEKYYQGKLDIYSQPQPFQKEGRGPAKWVEALSFTLMCLFFGYYVYCMMQGIAKQD